MANIKIKLTYDKETGKREIILDYEKDGSMTPIEHERRHRQIVKDLMGKGILKPDDEGNIRVGRVEEEQTSQANPAAPNKQRQTVNNQN